MLLEWEKQLEMVQEHSLGHVYLRWIFLAVIEDLAPCVYISFLCCWADWFRDTVCKTGVESGRLMKCYHLCGKSSLPSCHLGVAKRDMSWSLVLSNLVFISWVSHKTHFLHRQLCLVMLIVWDPFRGCWGEFSQNHLSSFAPIRSSSCLVGMEIGTSLVKPVFPNSQPVRAYPEKGWWQGSSWCQNESHSHFSTKRSDPRYCKKESYTESAQVSTGMRLGISKW